MSVHDENNHIMYKCHKCGVIYRDVDNHVCQENHITTKHRLTIEEYGCLLSLIGKGRSEDPKTRVSAVAIAKDKRVIGISYNGLKSGIEVPTWMFIDENRIKKAEYFIHAEQNLFSLLKKDECDLLCLNLSCCIKCCQTVAAHNVKKVVYLQEYHGCNKFKEFFKFHTIDCHELSVEGKQNIKNYLTDMTNFKELE
jgi:deoxycytidylate deaminase